MPGLFITLEGIDGCGKSTLMKELARELEGRGHDVVTTMEPSESWLGQAVRRSYSEDISPYSEAFLFLADRATHTKWMSRLVGEGRIVLCDRYSDSTISYQGAYLEEELARQNIDSVQWLWDVSQTIIKEPDITIILDIDPEISLARLTDRDGLSKFEKLDYLRKVRANYLRIAENGPRFRIIDASQSFEDVLAMVLEIINEKL